MQFILFLFLVFCVFSGCFMCSTPDTKVISCTYSPTTNKITGGAVYGGGFFDWVRDLFESPKKYPIKNSDKMPETITTHGKTYQKFDCKNTTYDETSAKCLFCQYPIHCRYQLAYHTNNSENVIHWECYNNYLGSHTDIPNQYPDIIFKNKTWYAMQKNYFDTNAVCNLCYLKLPHESTFIPIYRYKSNIYHINCFNKIRNIPELNQPDIINYTIREHPNTYRYMSYDRKKKETIYNDKNEKNQCINCNEIIDDNFYYSKDDKPSLGDQGLHLTCIEPYIRNQYTLGQREIPFIYGQILCDNNSHLKDETCYIDISNNWYYNIENNKNYHLECKPNTPPYVLTLGIRKSIPDKIQCMECQKLIDTKNNWRYNKNEHNYHPNCYDIYINRLFPKQ